MSQPQYLSLQETKALFEKPEYKAIVETLRYKGDDGKDAFEYDAYNPFGTGYLQEKYKVPRMGAEDAARLAETVKTVPFTHMAKEFLAQSGTTGIGGAAYLVPVKVHSILQTYAAQKDILSDVSMAVIPASEIPGKTLDIDIAKRSNYTPRPTASGGKAPEEEMAFKKSTLDFSKTLTVNFGIGNDLLEDTPQFSLMEVHIRMAGAEMGKKSTTDTLAIMATSTDGDGTMNTKAASEDAATMAEIFDAVSINMLDEWTSDRIICNAEFLKLTFSDVTYSAYATDFHNAAINMGPLTFFGLNWIRCDNPALYTDTGGVPTDCIAYVFSKEYSWLSGRKRWLRIENYSDPVRDLVGAVITSRQDTVSIYNDSICKVSE